MVGDLLAEGGRLAKLYEITEKINDMEHSKEISFPEVFVTFENVTSFEMATNGAYCFK